MASAMSMDDWLIKWMVSEHSLLGRGTFGRVFSGRDPSACAVAVKVQKYEDAESVTEFDTEIKSLELMKLNPHPNVIRLYDYLLDERARASGIAMEIATMDLRVMLATSGHRLVPDLAQSFGRQMVGGVAHLHRHGIIHRDIKPQNLLVCATVGVPSLKIGDFGSSKMAVPRNGMTGNMVTSWYRPPEVFSRRQTVRIEYGKPVDVWSIGCVLWELCLWSVAFCGKSDQIVAAMIAHRLGQPQTWPSGFPDKDQLPKVPPNMRTVEEAQALTGRPGELDKGVDLLRQCLTWLPGERLSAEQCCKHPFCEERGSAAGQDPAKTASRSAPDSSYEPHRKLPPTAGTGAGASQPPHGRMTGHHAPAEPYPRPTPAFGTGAGATQPLPLGRRNCRTAATEPRPRLTPAAGIGGIGACASQPLPPVHRIAAGTEPHPKPTPAAGTGACTGATLRRVRGRMTGRHAATEPCPRPTPAFGTGAGTTQPMPPGRRSCRTAAPGPRPRLSPAAGCAGQPLPPGHGTCGSAATEQPVDPPQCQCVGNCQSGHRLGQPCTQELSSSPTPTSGPALCDCCRCSSPDCSRARFRTKFCFGHAYESLGLEFRVIRHLHQEAIMQDMMPLDIQAFLGAQATFNHDLALELIAAWIKEPAAINALMAHRPTSKHYTGAELLISLQQVCGP